MPASYRKDLDTIYQEQHKQLDEISQEQKKLLNDRYKEEHKSDGKRTKEEHEKDKKRTIEMHAGLWLDKYIEKQERDDVGVRAQLVREVATLAEPGIYQQFYDRWRKQLLDEQGVQVREAHAKGRIIVGLGSESVLETSIALHRTYGMPYIPGSSLKGLVSSYVRNYLGDEWQKSKDSKDGQESNNRRAFNILFGDTKEAGYITFFDALYVPGSGGGVQKKALYPDIITVHHQQYYQRGGNISAPADWDSPIPVPFLSATGRYLIALAAPELQHGEKWIEKTFEILGYALRDIGIGAKTSSGYGRMTLHKEPEKKVERPADPAIVKLVEEIKDLPDKSFSSGSINKQLTLWLQNSQNPHATLIAQAIVDRVGSSGNAGKVGHMPLYQRLRASLQ